MESLRFFTTLSLVVLLCLSLGCENPQTNDAESPSVATGESNPTQIDGDKTPDAEGNSSGLVTETNEPEPSNDKAADTEGSNSADDAEAALAQKPQPPTIDIPNSWKRLSPEQEIWLDSKNKQVIVGGQICLTAGPLEMLICPRNTKEHESVISANVQSWQVHAALIALGFSPGEACKWDPEYSPAWGPTIEIEVMWKDAKSGEVKKIDGKQWILDIETEKPMEMDLVFGGSFTETYEETGQKYYTGNDGALICLANFSTATVDLRIENAQTQAFFEANTPKIPPLGTQVYAVIRGGKVIGKPDSSDR